MRIACLLVLAAVLCGCAGLLDQAPSPVTVLPADQAGCGPAEVAAGEDGAELDIIQRGTGSEDAHRQLIGLALCHTFRWMLHDPEETSSGFSEVWCTPPPGNVLSTAVQSNGWIVVFVDGPVREPGPQPPIGHGCP